MKTIELQNFGTVHYGTPEELKEKATELKIELPRIEQTRHYLSNQTGRPILFSSKSIHPDVDLERINLILLDQLLLNVSGEELGRGDCYKLAVEFRKGIRELSKEIKGDQ